MPATPVLSQTPAGSSRAEQGTRVPSDLRCMMERTVEEIWKQEGRTGTPQIQASSTSTKSYYVLRIVLSSS